MTPDRDEIQTHPVDEVIREVRANRETYASAYGFDVRAILKRSREAASELGRKATERRPRPVAIERSA